MGSFVRVAIILLAIGLICQCSDNPTKPTKLNHPPLLASVGPQSVQEGSRLEFIVQATDSDGTIPTLSVRNVPTNASAVDSGNGRMLFVFEPDLTQAGTYYITFISSDGKLTDSLIVTITVSPNRAAHTWPMAVGNYWVYEVSHWSGDDRGNGHGESRLDSICVLSYYQLDGVVHWRLNSGLPFSGYDITFENDSIVGMSQKIPIPSTWPDRTYSVPAGVFSPTYEYIAWGGSFSWMEVCSFIFAKNVGIIEYGWHNGRPMNFESYNARLIRYRLE
jgi:hypothetical protein